MASDRHPKRRLINEGFTDLLSDLPGNVIDNIMDRLPFREAARLSILSRKWKLIWTSYPHLKLDASFFGDMLTNKLSRCYEFNRILSKVLLSHHGPITKFFLHIPKTDYPSTHGMNDELKVWLTTSVIDLLRSNMNYMWSIDIDPTIAHLSRHGIQEITLDNYGSSRLKLSSRLFSCSNLKKLRLCQFDVNIPPSFECFKSIIKLELDHVTLTGRTLDSLISSCPALEILVVKGIVARESVVIDAPNLKSIEVEGTLPSICLTNCLSLSSVTIDLTERVFIKQGEEASDLVNFLSRSCKLQELNLRHHFFDLLGNVGLKAMSTNTFDHLRKLELSLVDSQQLIMITFAIVILRRCPNLEELKISFRSTARPFDDEINRQSNLQFRSIEQQFRSIEQPFDPEINRKSNISFNRLRTVYLMSPTCLTLALKFIRTLLAHAPVLEKLYIPSGVNTVPALALTLTTNLLRFPRASSKAEILFFDQKL